MIKDAIIGINKMNFSELELQEIRSTFCGTFDPDVSLLTKAWRGFKSAVVGPTDYPETLLLKVSDNPYTLRSPAECIGKFNKLFSDANDWSCAPGLASLLEIKEIKRTINYAGKEITVRFDGCAEGGSSDIIIEGDPETVNQLGSALKAFYDDLLASAYSQIQEMRSQLAWQRERP